MKTLAKNLKIFRDKMDLSQLDLANSLNVSSKAVSSWETGRTEPNIETLKQLAINLNCTVNDLLGLDSNCEEFELPVTNAITARKYIQSIPMISTLGNFDIMSLSDKETIEFANDLIQLIQIAVKRV